MEEEILSENMQEVAEPVEEVVETSEQTQEVAEPEPQQEVEQPKVEERNYEKDAAFARMRRELETATAEKEKLVKVLGQFGFNGKTVDDQIDQANAHYTGRSIEEVRQERIAEARKIAEENSLKEQLKYYKEKEVQERMNKDLADIQKLNPLIKTFDDLPKEYFDYVSKGIEGTKAYKLLEIDGIFQTATQNAEQKAVAKIQANAKASVGSASGGVSEPVSYANMSDAEFDKLLAKVKRGEMTSIT